MHDIVAPTDGWVARVAGVKVKYDTPAISFIKQLETIAMVTELVCELRYRTITSWRKASHSPSAAPAFVDHSDGAQGHALTA